MKAFINSIRIKHHKTDIISPSILLKKQKRGMTLIEIMVSIFIVTLVSITFYGSTIYTMRQTYLNISRTYAIQATNSLATRLRASRLTNLIKNPADMENPSFERSNFSSLTGTINTDSANTNQTQISYTITLKGFGNFTTQTANTTNVFTVRLPPRSAPWKNNEFAGYMITIISGAGQNQIGRIISHSASTAQGQNQQISDLKITSDLAQPITLPNASWSVRPDATSSFLLNYGINANIVSTWDNGKQSMETSVYVPY